MQNDLSTMESILIVDDTPENLRLLAKMLSAQGYKVRPAPSGSHALKTIKKEIPDLILLDVMMPEIDGYEVCRTIKAEEATKDIPIIFFSALYELEDKIRGFAAGGVDYITKPFHEKEVILRVKTHLKIRSLQLKLQTETARFKTLSEAAFEGILIHSKGQVINVNPEAARLFAYEEDELINTDLAELIPTEIWDQVLSDPAVVGMTSTVECEVIRKGNTRIPVELRTKNLPRKDQQVIAIRDLTRQKEAEQQQEELLQENTVLKISLHDRYRFGDFIGRSSAMQVVYELISKAAASKFPVVVYGESGTGKELAARMIHSLSKRKGEQLVTVNCGAITETLFERELFGHRKGAFTGAVRDEPGFLSAADKGTLFLDELGELSMSMQVKLLRVLENGEYTPVGDVVTKKADIRLIVATNKDISDLVQKGKFREDLFYRINVIQITLPPLRERREDIGLLVEHTLSLHDAENKMVKLPSKLSEMLYHYDWPGNVRELINTVQRFLATDNVALPGHAPQEAEANPKIDTGLPDALEELERRMILDALEQTAWHRANTADLLRIPRRSLHRKMIKHGLRPSE